MTAGADGRTINQVHYPLGDPSNPQELGTYLDGIVSNVTSVSTNLASTSAGKGASLIGIQDAGGIITATTVEGALAEVQAAVDALESGRAVKSQTAIIASGVIELPEGKSYMVIVKTPIAFTVTKIVTICTAGTATLTGKINTTALGGTANSVSTSEQEQTHSSANTASVGDDLVLTVSSTSSCEMLSFTVVGTVTLA